MGDELLANYMRGELADLSLIGLAIVAALVLIALVWRSK